MKKLINYLLMAGLMASTGCNNQSLKLVESKTLEHFPSGSSINLYKDQIIVVGDDATRVLLLNKHYEVVDSISIDSTGVERISKDEKPDFESSIVTSLNDIDHLIAFGSGSTDKRENILKIPLPLKHNLSFQFNSEPGFYKLIKQALQTDINIEGAAIINSEIILANRAHIKQPQNSFVVFNSAVLHNANANFQVSRCYLNLPSTKNIIGVSGLNYVSSSDALWFTASTEESANAIDDGKIGDSYIGFISNASKSIKNKSIEPNWFVNVSTIHPAFKGQKIESIAIEMANENEATLYLVADNDNGTTQLFKLSYKMN